jgi:hypothetical protein
MWAPYAWSAAARRRGVWWEPVGVIGARDADRGQHRHDNFWGRCTAHARREDCPRFHPAVFARHGDNWLGRLQMQIRAELAVLFI